MPLAMTVQAPMIKVADGLADQNIQSIKNAQSMAVYSNGATTEGGARRKASVSHICPSAPVMPMPTSQPQSAASTGRQSRADKLAQPRPTMSRYQNTMDMLELLRPSVRTVSALNE